MTTKQCNISMLCSDYYTFLSEFLNTWKQEMLYEEQDIQWKHNVNVLKFLKIYNTIKDHYSLWAYCVFI